MAEKHNIEGCVYSESPLVSVITNTLNGEKYLRETIESILAQTYRNWELIIWDNCSNDRTADIAQSYDDERIHYFLADHFTALGEARNPANRESRGDIIGFLDSYDVWFLKNWKSRCRCSKNRRSAS